MGVRTSADEINVWKIKKRKHAKKSSFLCLCYILRAIRAGRCRERRYADHIFIEIYFRMHNFVVKFSKFSSPQAARGHWPPNKNPADVPISSRRQESRIAEFWTTLVRVVHSARWLNCRRLHQSAASWHCVSVSWRLGDLACRRDAREAHETARHQPCATIDVKNV